MILGSSIKSARQTSLLTGIARRNIKSGLVRRIALESRTDLVWAVSSCTKRVDALAPGATKLVEEFWTGNTRISPNRKDVVKKRIGAKQWINHPTHHLQESQVSPDKHYLDMHQKELALIFVFQVMWTLKCNCKINLYPLPTEFDSFFSNYFFWAFDFCSSLYTLDSRTSTLVWKLEFVNLKH